MAGNLSLHFDFGMNAYEAVGSHSSTMKVQKCVRLVLPYFKSEKRFEAIALLFGVCIFAVCSTVMLVLISYQERNLNTALSEKQESTFYTVIVQYFMIILVAVPFFAFYSYFSSLFSLRWRSWLTESIMKRYLSDQAYYRISQGYSDQLDNPDQRIQEDVKAFTGQSVTFILLIVQQCFQVIGFAGVLYSISPLLVFFLVSYAFIGTVVATKFFGMYLIPINASILKAEADFRFALVRLGENSESIAFYSGEELEEITLSQRFRAVVDKLFYLLVWQRHLSMFQNGYLFLTYLLPPLVVAPAYFRGDVEFGAISQTSMAFRMIMNAVSVIVTQFDEISAFVAGSNRLIRMDEFLDDHAWPLGSERLFEEMESKVMMKCVDLSIVTPNSTLLVEHVNFDIEKGNRIIVVGISGIGKSSLLRTLAGLWSFGSGSVIFQASLKKAGQIMFLPQKPYIPLGTFRHQLSYPFGVSVLQSDDQLLSILRKVGLGSITDHSHGLDFSDDWGSILSIGEQQRLAFARVLVHKPKIVFLDEATSALDEANERMCYDLLALEGITVVSVGHRSSLLAFHTHVLKIEEGTAYLRVL